AVISYAIAHKYRETSNPAIWKGLLDKFYPNPNKVKEIQYEKAGKDRHHNALSYDKAAVFMAELCSLEGIAAKALRFTILTASRTGEVRFSTWDEFNLDKGEWNIPKSRMKARKAHRVALSDAAVQLLRELPRVEEFVFPGWKVGCPMSDGAMAGVLKRMGRTGVTVHGFRSTFRDYIGEETGFPYRLAEFALAHGLTDEAEKAYARGDMLMKRFKMMNVWADYLDSLVNGTGVIPTNRMRGDA
ncbi:MAG TPA: integrase, partial [Methylophaga sp.]|nr:integrase [Methylophaga sp.]